MNVTSEQSAQCAVIESYVQSHLESWIGAKENLRQWDLIRLRFVDDVRVAAIIYRLPSGRHEIMIGRNFVCSLLELVENCWGKFGNLSDENQRWKVEAIAKYSVLLVYYHEFAHVKRHASLDAYLEDAKPNRVFACTTKGKVFHHEPKYEKGDALLFGPETRGLPNDIIMSLPEACRVRIPMSANSRSMNLSNAVSVFVYESWRQLGFENAC